MLGVYRAHTRSLLNIEQEQKSKERVNEPGREREDCRSRKEARTRSGRLRDSTFYRAKLVCVCVYELAVVVAAHPPLESPLKVRRDAKEGVERIPFSLFFSRDELCA